MQVLDGIRVLDLTHVFAGPFCAYQLGVMGAEVIKIEPVGTPDMTRETGARDDLSAQGMGLGFVAQGAGKKAIALDLTSADGKSVFKELVKSADVLVQNYTSACLEKLGLLPEQLQAINPRLICCSISGYGRTGPKADHPAYDVVIQAFSGVMASNGEADSPPVRVGPPIIDYGTGAQAALAVCAALFARERTGKARVIDVAMSDCALMLMTANVVTANVAGKAPTPFGNRDPGLATYSAYPTADGTVMLGAFTPKQAANLMAALGIPELAEETRSGTLHDMMDRRDRYEAFIRPILLTRTAAEWEDLLNAAHVPAARVRTLDEALTHPQFAARQVIQKVEANGETMRLPVAGFRMNGTDISPSGPPHGYGADTDAVLESLGYSAADISQMRDSGAIA